MRIGKCSGRGKLVTTMGEKNRMCGAGRWAGAAVAMVALVPVASAESGWFGGISAAQALLRQTDISRSGSLDGSDRMTSTVNVHRNLRLEMGYADPYRSGGSDLPVLPGAPVRGRGWQLSGVGTLPIGDRFGVFGRVGAYRGDLALNPNYNGSSDLTQATYGMGLKYDFSTNLRVQGGWDRYRLSLRPGSQEVGQDVDLLSIGLKYKF